MDRTTWRGRWLYMRDFVRFYWRGLKRSPRAINRIIYSVEALRGVLGYILLCAASASVVARYDDYTSAGWVVAAFLGVGWLVGIYDEHRHVSRKKQRATRANRQLLTQFRDRESALGETRLRATRHLFAGALAEIDKLDAELCRACPGPEGNSVFRKINTWMRKYAFLCLDALRSGEIQSSALGALRRWDPSNSSGAMLGMSTQIEGVIAALDHADHLHPDWNPDGLVWDTYSLQANLPKRDNPEEALALLQDALARGKSG